MLEKSVEGKSFILIIPNDFKIYEIFEFNIQKIGFDLTSIVPADFKYENNFLRVKNFFLKNFFGNRTYKKELIRKFRSGHMCQEIGHLGEKSIDYILVIRPDIFDNETIQKLLNIGKKVVGYQWDGLKRYPEVFNFIPLFEKFLIFDENDYKNYHIQFPNIQLCDNFFFDFDDEAENCSKNNTIYYVGSYIENRIDDLIYAMDELAKFDVNFDINLKYFRSKKPINKPYIKFFKDNFTFRDNIKRLKAASIILDFKVLEHNGLSLRFFESLRYEKKIITNNKTVMEYDFYNPQNIFIIHHDDMSRLGEFISTPYKEISKEIVDQYSFSSWLSKYVL
jgi:hypothetical protein